MIPLAARRKAMMAAELVDTSSIREAAILGGIVRCVCSCGRINVPWVAQYAADILAAFNPAGVSLSPATRDELAVAVQQFQQSYSQPFTQ